MDSLAGAIILMEQERARNIKYLKLQRKYLRDLSNPLDIDESKRVYQSSQMNSFILTVYFKYINSQHRFIKNYSLNKAAFSYVLGVLERNSKSTRSSSISLLHRLSSVLRFFAEGGYQHGVSKDYDIPMAQSTFCGVLNELLASLQSHLCPQWINLDMTEEEMSQAKREFYQKYRFPGVILCVDGTHIKIVAPTKDKYLYFNRKRYFSINTMIICDNKMRIRYVKAQYPGCNHDSHIWNVSNARYFFEKKYLDGVRNTWLLGDAGYALEPWLMTPFRTPLSGSPEYKFNQIHAKTRNIVERTIGVLKNRFRCLLGTRELHYEPWKVCQIVNVAAALHNICIHYGVVDDIEENIEPYILNENAELTSSNYHDAASHIRQCLARSLSRE